jgi:serine/threonine protein kinase
METERWRQVDELLQRALDRPAEERSAFLEKECAGDVALRHEVESLILSSEEGASFIARSSLDSDLPVRESTSLEIGRVMGGYQILRRLGSGGMGEVYLARHTQHERPAALKILPAHYTSDAQRNERFRRESRAVLRLNHPNVVTAYDIGEEGGVPYIATEFVEGETLGTRLETNGSLELTEALDVAAQVAAALVYAHEQGVVHRDIKPENVMLRSDGYVKVLDFGIAKLDTRQAASDLTK